MNGIMRACFLILVLVMAACQRAPDKVVIGVGLSRDDFAGVELAVEHINQTGGVNGVPMEVVSMDWNIFEDTHPIAVARWAQTFSKKSELLAVIGHSDSASTLASAAIYNEHAIPQIVTIATSPAISGIGPWTFRLCPTDREQGRLLAEYAVESWKKPNIGIIMVNDEYGWHLTRVFEESVLALGGNIAFRALHRNRLLKDDQELIQSTLRSHSDQGTPIDLILLVQRPAAAEWTIAAIRETGLPVALLASDSLSRTRFLLQNPEQKQGLRVGSFFVPSDGSGNCNWFCSMIEERTGFPPDAGQAFAFDAVTLLKAALEEDGFSREGIKRYLRRLSVSGAEIDGIGGNFSLDSTQDGRRAYHILEVQGPSLRLLDTLS